MSSSVGPRPPVVITTLDLRAASLMASSRRASSSPTIVLSFTSIPRRLSCSVSQRLLVSVRSGASSSDPIAMISAVRVSNKWGLDINSRKIDRHDRRHGVLQRLVDVQPAVLAAETLQREPVVRLRFDSLEWNSGAPRDCLAVI